MFGLLLPVLVIVLAVVIVNAVRRRRPTGAVRLSLPSPAEPGRPASAAAPPVAEGLDDALDRWTAAGLLTEGQATAIRSHEAARVPAPPTRAGRVSRVPAVAEALGYLGGVLVAAGLVIIVAQAWSDLGSAGRIGVSVGGAVALLVGGALVREGSDPAAARLRWFLWFAGTAAAGLAAGVVAVDVFDASARPVALGVAVTVTVLSALLWRFEERPLQQLTALGGLIATAGALAAQWGDEGAWGLAMWAAGGAVLAVGITRTGWTRRVPLPILTVGVGGVGLLVGAITAASGQEGGRSLLIAGTALVLLTLTQVPQLPLDRPTLVVLGALGGLAFVLGVPSSIGWYIQDAAVVTGLVVWALGAAALAAGSLLAVRTPVLVVLAGGLGLIVGAALTGKTWEEFAPLFGIATSIVLIGLGMLPGRVLLSLIGSVGLLVNVPWAIGVFFPGEGRAPVLIVVSGLLIIGVAVLLNRMSGRFRSELGGRGGPNPPPLHPNHT